MQTRELPEPPADFAVDRETLAYIVLKAKAFDGLVASDDPTDGSNSVDDRAMDALEDESDNPVQRDCMWPSANSTMTPKLLWSRWRGLDAATMRLQSGKTL
ncbi:MAG: hypothetical protein IPL62_00430 [Caulobacteraceae bacterium]|nr:hypothetical protein [Caulobacteraceae bacterium]